MDETRQTALLIVDSDKDIGWHVASVLRHLTNEMVSLKKGRVQMLNIDAYQSAPATGAFKVAVCYMPLRKGLDVLAKAREKDRKVRAVVITNAVVTGMIGHIVAKGVDDLAITPLSPSALMKRIVGTGANQMSSSPIKH